MPKDKPVQLFKVNERFALPFVSPLTSKIELFNRLSISHFDDTVPKYTAQVKSQSGISRLTMEHLLGARSTTNLLHNAKKHMNIMYKAALTTQVNASISKIIPSDPRLVSKVYHHFKGFKALQGDIVDTAFHQLVEHIPVDIVPHDIFEKTFKHAEGAEGIFKRGFGLAPTIRDPARGMGSLQITMTVDADQIFGKIGDPMFDPIRKPQLMTMADIRTFLDLGADADGDAVSRLHIQNVTQADLFEHWKRTIHKAIGQKRGGFKLYGNTPNDFLDKFTKTFADAIPALKGVTANDSLALKAALATKYQMDPTGFNSSIRRLLNTVDATAETRAWFSEASKKGFGIKPISGTVKDVEGQIVRMREQLSKIPMELMTPEERSFVGAWKLGDQLAKGDKLAVPLADFFATHQQAQVGRYVNAYMKYMTARTTVPFEKILLGAAELVGDTWKVPHKELGKLQVVSDFMNVVVQKTISSKYNPFRTFTETFDLYRLGDKLLDEFKARDINFVQGEIKPHEAPLQYFAREWRKEVMGKFGPYIRGEEAELGALVGDTEYIKRLRELYTEAGAKEEGLEQLAIRDMKRLLDVGGDKDTSITAARWAGDYSYDIERYGGAQAEAVMAKYKLEQTQKEIDHTLKNIVFKKKYDPGMIDYDLFATLGKPEEFISPKGKIKAALGGVELYDPVRIKEVISRAYDGSAEHFRVFRIADDVFGMGFKVGGEEIVSLIPTVRREIIESMPAGAQESWFYKLAGGAEYRAPMVMRTGPNVEVIRNLLERSTSMTDGRFNANAVLPHEIDMMMKEAKLYSSRATMDYHIEFAITKALRPHGAKRLKYLPEMLESATELLSKGSLQDPVLGEALPKEAMKVYSLPAIKGKGGYAMPDLIELEALGKRPEGLLDYTGQEKFVKEYLDAEVIPRVLEQEVEGYSRYVNPYLGHPESAAGQMVGHTGISTYRYTVAPFSQQQHFPYASNLIRWRMNPLDISKDYATQISRIAPAWRTIPMIQKQVWHDQGLLDMGGLSNKGAVEAQKMFSGRQYNVAIADLGLEDAMYVSPKVWNEMSREYIQGEKVSQSTMLENMYKIFRDPERFAEIEDQLVREVDGKKVHMGRGKFLKLLKEGAETGKPIAELEGLTFKLRPDEFIGQQYKSEIGALGDRVGVPETYQHGAEITIKKRTIGTLLGDVVKEGGGKPSLADRALPFYDLEMAKLDEKGRRFFASGEIKLHMPGSNKGMSIKMWDETEIGSFKDKIGGVEFDRPIDIWVSTGMKDEHGRAIIDQVHKVQRERFFKGLFGEDYGKAVGKMLKSKEQRQVLDMLIQMVENPRWTASGSARNVEIDAYMTLVNSGIDKSLIPTEMSRKGVSVPVFTEDIDSIMSIMEHHKYKTITRSEMDVLLREHTLDKKTLKEFGIVDEINFDALSDKQKKKIFGSHYEEYLADPKMSKTVYRINPMASFREASMGRSINPVHFFSDSKFRREMGITSSDNRLNIMVALQRVYVGRMGPEQSFQSMARRDIPPLTFTSFITNDMMDTLRKLSDVEGATQPKQIFAIMQQLAAVAGAEWEEMKGVSWLEAYPHKIPRETAYIPDVAESVMARSGDLTEGKAQLIRDTVTELEEGRLIRVPYRKDSLVIETAKTAGRMNQLVVYADDVDAAMRELGTEVEVFPTQRTPEATISRIRQIVRRQGGRDYLNGRPEDARKAGNISKWGNWRSYMEALTSDLQRKPKLPGYVEEILGGKAVGEILSSPAAHKEYMDSIQAGLYEVVEGIPRDMREQFKLLTRESIDEAFKGSLKEPIIPKVRSQLSKILQSQGGQYAMMGAAAIGALSLARRFFFGSPHPKDNKPHEPIEGMYSPHAQTRQMGMFGSATNVHVRDEVKSFWKKNILKAPEQMEFFISENFTGTTNVNRLQRTSEMAKALSKVDPMLLAVGTLAAIAAVNFGSAMFGTGRSERPRSEMPEPYVYQSAKNINESVFNNNREVHAHDYASIPLDAYKNRNGHGQYGGGTYSALREGGM